jgi:hypothetical protein
MRQLADWFGDGKSQDMLLLPFEMGGSYDVEGFTNGNVADGSVVE